MWPLSIQADDCATSCGANCWLLHWDGKRNIWCLVLLFVARAAFGEPLTAFCVAGAAFGQAVLACFVAGARNLKPQVPERVAKRSIVTLESNVMLVFRGRCKTKVAGDEHLTKLASNSSRASLSCCFSFIHHPLSCFRQHYVFLRTVYIVVWSSCQNASWTETCVHLVEIPQHHYPFKCKTHIVQLHAITSIAYVVQRRQKQIEATRCNWRHSESSRRAVRKAWSWLSPQSVLSLSIFCATSTSWHGPSFHPRQGISTMSTMAMVTAITMYYYDSDTHQNNYDNNGSHKNTTIYNNMSYTLYDVE